MLNHVDIMGRLTRDPELRHTQSGTAVASFSIASDRDFKGQDGEKQTDFFDCVAWRNTAEYVSKYFSKGRMLVVSGKLQTRNWTDKDGKNHKAVEILADNVYFGDSKKPIEQSAEQADKFNSFCDDLDGRFSGLTDADGELPF